MKIAHCLLIIVYCIRKILLFFIFYNYLKNFQNYLGIFILQLSYLHQPQTSNHFRMQFSKLSDNDLVAYLQQGSQKAFEEIYTRYWYRLFGVAYQSLGTKEEAEELVQDIFENLWKKRQESIIQHLGAYLVVSTKHRCTNYIKSQINFRKFQEYQIFHEIQQQSQSGEAVIHFTDLAEAVEKAMKNLPEKTCEIFKKSRFESMSVKEIALHFDLTEKAVEYHITKSLRVLKEELKLYSSDN